MVALYLTSLARGSGKTALCAGLGRRLADDGEEVGFLRPSRAESPMSAQADARLMKDVLSLDGSVEDMCPALAQAGDIAGQVREAANRVSKGKDVLIIEGEDESNQASYSMVKALDARVLIVDVESREAPSDRLVAAQKFFAPYVLGAVINKVPMGQMEEVAARARESFQAAGLPLLAVLPEDRALFTLTIGQLAEAVQGEILNNVERAQELAESFMLGAMCVDSGRSYFERMANKVAVLRSERGDMQLAALQTSTRGLVVAGSRLVLPPVRLRAEEKQVPIIQVSGDVPTTISRITDALGAVRFSTEKLPRMGQLLEQHFDFPALRRGLGLGA